MKAAAAAAEGEVVETTPPPPPPLRGFFFPLLSPGHMIPLIDIAKLLSRRGVSAFVVTTPANEPFVRPSIDRANSSPSPSSLPISLLLLPFPSSPSLSLSLPFALENLSNLPPPSFPHLFSAISSLRPSLRDLLLLHRADFLFSDAVHIWTADLAADLRIPHILFSGHGAFPLCIHHALEPLNPYARAETCPPIVLDHLPHPIQLTKPEISEIFRFPPILQAMSDAEAKSFGVVVNTFYAMEPAYADIFRRGRAGRRAWFVGPVSFSDVAGRADRGGRAHPDTPRVMSWLDSQPVRSVVYACFGSLCRLDAAQMREAAAGLEESGRRFIWAVRDWAGAEAPAGWMPEGFEERVEGRGWVIRGWAPQAEILAHDSVGGFVTHCGWNSMLEGVAAGVPMVAWPLMYEQFVNERLIVDVLRVGVRVRVRKGGEGEEEAEGRVTAEEVAEAVGRVVGGGGEEAEGLRRRARELAAAAKAAVEVGGSSYEDVGRMVEELEAQVGRASAAGGK